MRSSNLTRLCSVPTSGFRAFYPKGSLLPPAVTPHSPRPRTARLPSVCMTLPVLGISFPVAFRTGFSHLSKVHPTCTYSIPFYFLIYFVIFLLYYLLKYQVII